LKLIAGVCTRLDGLPLAIELAAARTKFLSLKELRNQLDNRFALLKESPTDFPDRHQTLEQAIAWSYDLLSEEEQIFLSRLSVFQGSRSIEAVEAVCCRDLPLQVLDGLESLYNKNLIQQEVGLDGETRFFMLETIHEFARQRIKDRGEMEKVSEWHAIYFVELAEQGMYPSRGGPDQYRWLNRLKADHDNLRAAYDWSMDNGEVELALRLVGTLDYFWFRMGSYTEGKDWVINSLEYIDDVPASVKAGVYGAAGMVYYFADGNSELSKHMFKEALSLHEALGNKREMGWIHAHLMDPSEMFIEQREEVLEHFTKCTALLSEVGDQVGIAQAWSTLGVHESFCGDLNAAREAYQKGLEIAKTTGDYLREGLLTGNLANLLEREGDLLAAQRMYRKSLRNEMEYGANPVSQAINIIDIASTMFDLNHPWRAVVMLSAAERMFDQGGYHPQPAQLDYVEELYSSSRTKLDPDAYQKAWAEGQAMSPEQAIAYALDEADSE
jgi:non-specific serine/threonine protein kinase